MNQSDSSDGLLALCVSRSVFSRERHNVRMLRASLSETSSNISVIQSYIETEQLCGETNPGSGNNCYISCYRNITQHIRPTERDVAELNNTFGEFVLINSDSEGNNPDRP